MTEVSFNDSELLADAEILIGHFDSIIDKAKVRDSIDTEIVCAVLAARILEGAQATILLLKSGYSFEADNVIRSILEACIFMGACCKDESFVVQFRALSAFNNIDNKNMLIKYSDHLHLNNDDISDLELEKKRIEDFLKENNLYKLTPKRAAESLGLLSFYWGYRMHSGSIHNDPEVLKSVYLEYKGNSVLGIKLGPKTIQINQVLMTLVASLLLSIKWYMALFILPEIESVNELFDKYRPDIRG